MEYLLWQNDKSSFSKNILFWIDIDVSDICLNRQLILNITSWGKTKLYYGIFFL